MSACASFSVMRWSIPGLCAGSVTSTSASRSSYLWALNASSARAVVGHESNDGLGALHPRADGQDLDSLAAIVLAISLSFPMALGTRMTTSFAGLVFNMADSFAVTVGFWPPQLA